MPPKGKGGGLNTLAIYPIPDSPNEITELIANSEIFKGKFNWDNAEPQHDLFFTLQTKNGDLAKNALKLSGKLEYKNQKVLISLVDKNQMNGIYDTMWTILPGLIDGETVNLSNLNSHGITQQIFRPGVGSFIVFLAACYVASKNLQDSIINLRFDNNGLQNTRIAWGIKGLFPALESISFENNPLTEDESKIESDFARDGIKLGVSTKESWEPFPLFAGRRHDPWTEDGVPVSAMEPIEVIHGTPAPVIEKTEFDDIQPIELSEDDNPIDMLIHRLTYYLANNLENLVNLYAPTAVFSLTVDDCHKGSPLKCFEKFSQNFLKEPSEENILRTPQAIASAHQTLFGEGVSTVVSGMTTCELMNGLYAVVLIGMMDTPVGSIAFNRSMAIGIVDEECLITNDHLYLFEPPI